MTNEEFDNALNMLDIRTGEAAREIAELGGGKASASYISSMRKGPKPVSQAAAIYARLKIAHHNATRVITKQDVLGWIEANSRDL